MNGLTRLALLGTGQIAEAPDECGDSRIARLIDALGPLDRERALLLRAGLHGALRRAALVQPARALASGPPNEAPPDLRPVASPKLAQLLELLLAGNDTQLLAEALGRAAHKGLRLPHELLPRALAQTAAERRTLLRPLLDARGLWLAAQRPEWGWALELADASGELPSELPSNPEARFAEGSPAERKLLLAQLRRRDRALARKLLLESGTQEKAEHRLAFVALLAAELGADDEPLLNGMLADRSAQVRAAAAQLLWRLPESALGQRMRERAQQLITYTRRAGLQVALPPAELDPAWERDGILPAPHESGLGPRQAWLMQLISALPPELWCQKFALEPPALIEAATAHELGDVLLLGLSKAALRHDSRRFVAPLWRSWLAQKEPSANQPLLAALTARLTPIEYEPTLLPLLESDRGTALLLWIATPWPERIARAFLRAVARAPASWATSLRAAAYAIDPALLPDQLPPPLVAEDDPDAFLHRSAFEHFQSVAAVRRSIAQETAP